MCNDMLQYFTIGDPSPRSLSLIVSPSHVFLIFFLPSFLPPFIDPSYHVSHMSLIFLACLTSLPLFSHLPSLLLFHYFHSFLTKLCSFDSTFQLSCNSTTLKNSSHRQFLSSLKSILTGYTDEISSNIPIYIPPDVMLEVTVILLQEILKELHH